MMGAFCKLLLMTLVSGASQELEALSLLQLQAQRRGADAGPSVVGAAAPATGLPEPEIAKLFSVHDGHKHVTKAKHSDSAASHSAKSVLKSKLEHVKSGHHKQVEEEQRWHRTDVCIILLALGVVWRVRSVATGENRVLRSTDAWTGLRFVLSSSVFLGHVGLTKLTCAGRFLVLSGAVLSFSKVEEYTTRDGYVLFMMRRLGRVAPIYWLVVLVHNLGKEMPTNEFVQTLFISTSWFTENMSWLWFVSTVAWLYVFFPAIGLAVSWLKVPGSTGRSFLLMVFAFALQLAVAVVVYRTEDLDPEHPLKFVRRVRGDYVVSMYQWPPARLPEFLLGTGLAHFGLSLQGTGAKVLGPLGDLACLSLVGLAVWSSPAFARAPSPHEDILEYVYRMDLTSPLFCLWVLGTGFGSWSWTAGLLQTRTMLALGELSYGFYLWHYIFLTKSFFLDVGDGPRTCHVLAGADEMAGCSARSLALRFAVTLIAAYATYELIERPAAGWIKTLRLAPRVALPKLPPAA